MVETKGGSEMSEQFKVDLDNETIEVDAKRMSRDQLSAEITKLISSGNFRVGRLAAALEHLDSVLSAARELRFRIDGDSFSRLSTLARNSGKEPSILARDLLVLALGAEATESAEPAESEAALAESPELAPAATLASSVQDLVNSLAIAPEEVLTSRPSPEKSSASLVSGDASSADGGDTDEVVLDLGVVAKKK